MKRPQDILGKLRRASKKPPSVIARRLITELRGEADRWLAPKRGVLQLAALLRRTNARSLDELWIRLADRPFPAVVRASQLTDFKRICPGAIDEILARAQAALDRRVDILGSGELILSRPVNWHVDHKTGLEWKPAYFRDIDYNNPDRPSDVKMAWELSRLQWVMPLGQAWLLTGDERYPVMAKQLIEEWIDGNPYAATHIYLDMVFPCVP
jgi:hypothetical protein